MSAL
ncbi:hypothetical protein VTH06DRAFT_6406 [Thermothelomyces fergusii]|jgi:hypothetical protein